MLILILIFAKIGIFFRIKKAFCIKIPAFLCFSFALSEMDFKKI